MKQHVIVLQTDFGTKDSCVGIMKGTMLSIYPRLTFVDLTHDIDPFNILSASYNIHSSWTYFPKGTIFLSVVDPGVGSARKILLASAYDRFLVTPDNGTLSITCRLSHPVETFLPEQNLLASLAEKSSFTFQGRDIFAPLAAFIARDGFHMLRGSACGPVILPDAYPVIDSAERTLIGTIMHIDRFGNCISSIHKSDLDKIGGIADKQITFFGNTIRKLHAAYSNVDVGDQVAYIGSAGFLEIGIREGNASETTGLRLRDEVLVG